MDPSSPSGGKVDAQPLASPLPSASTPVGAVARDLYERIRDMGANMRRDAGPRAEGRYVTDLVRRDAIVSPEAIRMTAQDRVIFMVFVFVAHLVVLNLTEWLIATSAVRTFRGALLTMASIYSLLFAVLVAAVNVGDGDLRIVFNYVNRQSSSTRIWVHIGLLWLVVGIAVITLRATPRGGPAVTDGDRAALNSRLESVSAAIWYTLAVLSVAL